MDYFATSLLAIQNFFLNNVFSFRQVIKLIKQKYIKQIIDH